MGLQTRFWAKVNRRGPDECWPWTAGANSKGYGKISVNGRYRLAHRVAWELANQKPVPPGLTVDHACGVPLCVNPRHLEAVSNLENNRRGGLRRRNLASAENKPLCNSCLTTEQISAIRQDPRGYKALARIYNVDRTTIRGIKLRRTYAHIL